ncbi:MAG: deoxyribodipyrimidine photo-lyase [Dehalococcoidales bacterium]|nr:deoxyribodipyrimidine photo-lyase [Dehalococcoidales bacterium]
MIQAERISYLNSKKIRKAGYVLYWMQASQRTEHNHALEFAIDQANKLKLPLLVFFGLTEGFPEANERHYRFMLEGLKEVKESLRSRGTGMIVRRISPEAGAVEYGQKAAAVICDRGYLRRQATWRRYVAERIDCLLIQVETDAIVPVETASPGEEYSAATLRRKLHKTLPHFLVPVETATPLIDSTGMAAGSIDLPDVSAAMSGLDFDRTVRPSPFFTGGSAIALERLERFILNSLDGYSQYRNDPNREGCSGLSPYLHFGQISPLHIALKVLDEAGPDNEAFLEELIVRRELGLNFVRYNPAYDRFAGLPTWAKRTLDGHRTDPRPYLYSRDELEQALTHDPYWNAAQREMTSTGKMHGYMRMYWGKKILEWTASPEEAFDTALYLNNKYELDGRDPNSYAGVAWCFGKHDRPWATRPVFGNIRYMNDRGLKRKFDADRYASEYSRENTTRL